MPAIIAHHAFGIEACCELHSAMGTSVSADVRDAFLLGNQGPDPLFCLRALPARTPYRAIGSTMHAAHTSQLLQALHRHGINCEHDAVRAYAFGFLCHYLLDSTAHPLVYAQQHALCGAGGAKRSALTTADGATVHAAIETELDELVLRSRLGMTVSEFSPHRETLRCSDAALARISSAMARIAADAYGLAMPRGAFASSVWLYRAAQGAIDSKREGLRRVIDYARLTGRRYPHVLALTHSARGSGRTAFANDDHVGWPHPFEPGAVVSASFDELYDAAFERAAEIFPKFAHSEFCVSTCEELAPLLNFRGERVGQSG